MIRLSDIDFRYPTGEFRLRVADLTVDAGSSVAVIGPSGAGKTTLLKLIAGVEQPQNGRIELEGVDIARHADADRRRRRIQAIGMVFQEFELLDYLSVLDNILLPYRLTGALTLTGEVRERASDLARRVGVGNKLKRRVTRLSHGEMQRVAICRALLARPALVLADEPTGSLDPANKGRILDILFDYVQETGATLVTVTHDHELIDRFDRIVDFASFEVEYGSEDRNREPTEEAVS